MLYSGKNQNLASCGKEQSKMSKLTLERAKEILPKYTTENHLFVHAACVSAAMGAMADYYGEIGRAHG